MSLGLIFLTGLTTGGLSCLAVQGGLLASVIANQKKEGKLAVGAFLGAKLLAHTILGWLLGSLGAVASLSLEARVVFQALTALFMLGTAANLLEIHPIFRYLSWQPPRFLQKLIRNSAKSQAIFGPAILGVLTIFIPCGVTQAMEVLAINSGKAATGALTMFIFVLGTMPLFSLIGMATTKASETWQKKFKFMAVAALIIMAVYSLNSALVAIDSPLAIKALRKNSEQALVATKEGRQSVTINITNRGYNPNFIQVKVGIPVELSLVSNNARSCAVAFVFNEFKIRTVLGSNDKQVFKFTPNKKGRFNFSCSMGMYTGVMEVI